MAANLELIIKAKDEASAVLGNVDKKASGLSGTLGTGMKLAGAAAAVGIGAAVVAGIDFVKQAAEEQEGIAKLGAAVDANGGNWAANRAEIEKVIASRQRLAFSDDEQRDSLAFLVAQTGDVNEALSRQRTAMDLARGSGLDLASASKLLGKVTDESHAALGRLGIVVDKNASSQEVLAAVQQRFGGQAEAFAGTATAKWQRFNIALDNIKESIGSALLPIVTKLGEKLSIFLEEHQEDIDKAVASWTEFANSKVWPTLEDAFTQLTQLIDGIMATGIIQWITEHKEAMIALGIALLALALAFGGPIIVIPALIAAGTLLLANWDAIENKAVELYDTVVEKFNGIIASVQGIPVLGAVFTDTFNTIYTAVKFWMELVLAEFKFIIDTVKNEFDFWKAIFTGDWGAAWDAVKAEFQAVVDLFDNIMGAALDAVRAIVSSKLTMLTSIGSDIGNAIMGGIKAAFGAAASLGTDLANAILGGFKGAWNTMAGAINNAIPNEIGIDIPEVDLGPLGSIGGGRASIGLPDNPFPTLAQGGIVTKPTLALLGEAGPEAIVPLRNGGTGNIFNLYYQPTYSQATPAEAQRFAIWVKQALRS